MMNNKIIYYDVQSAAKADLIKTLYHNTPVRVEVFDCTSVESVSAFCLGDFGVGIVSWSPWVIEECRKEFWPDEVVTIIGF